MQKFKESRIGRPIFILGNGLMLLGVYFVSTGLVFAIGFFFAYVILILAQSELGFMVLLSWSIVSIGCFGPLLTAFFASWWYLKEEAPTKPKELRFGYKAKVSWKRT